MQRLDLTRVDKQILDGCPLLPRGPPDRTTTGEETTKCDQRFYFPESSDGYDSGYESSEAFSYLGKEQHTDTSPLSDFSDDDSDWDAASDCRKKLPSAGGGNNSPERLFSKVFTEMKSNGSRIPQPRARATVEGQNLGIVDEARLEAQAAFHHGAEERRKRIPRPTDFEFLSHGHSIRPHHSRLPQPDRDLVAPVPAVSEFNSDDEEETHEYEVESFSNGRNTHLGTDDFSAPASACNILSLDQASQVSTELSELPRAASGRVHSHLTSDFGDDYDDGYEDYDDGDFALGQALAESPLWQGMGDNGAPNVNNEMLWSNVTLEGSERSDAESDESDEEGDEEADKEAVDDEPIGGMDVSSEPHSSSENQQVVWSDGDSNQSYLGSEREEVWSEEELASEYPISNDESRYSLQYVDEEGELQDYTFGAHRPKMYFDPEAIDDLDIYNISENCSQIANSQERPQNLSSPSKEGNLRMAFQNGLEKSSSPVSIDASNGVGAVQEIQTEKVEHNHQHLVSYSKGDKLPEGFVGELDQVNSAIDSEIEVSNGDGPRVASLKSQSTQTNPEEFEHVVPSNNVDLVDKNIRSHEKVIDSTVPVPPLSAHFKGWRLIMGFLALLTGFVMGSVITAMFLLRGPPGICDLDSHGLVRQSTLSVPSGANLDVGEKRLALLNDIDSANSSFFDAHDLCENRAWSSTNFLPRTKNIQKNKEGKEERDMEGEMEVAVAKNEKGQREENREDRAVGFGLQDNGFGFFEKWMGTFTKVSSVGASPNPLPVMGPSWALGLLKAGEWVLGGAVILGLLFI